MKAPGIVSLVGAGPGDPELLTLKARRLLESCDVVVYDYLVPPAVLDWVAPTAERLCVGKRPGAHSTPQEEINRLLVEQGRAGRRVVRLKGGDPFIFGRGGEEAEALRAAGVPYEVVPAVTAALGCSAYAGIPLTHRAHSHAVTFISGHDAPGGPDTAVDWASYARTEATLVLYMAMTRLPEIAQALITGGRAAETPVAVVEWGTTPRQRVLHSRLDQVAADVAAASYGAPAIVVVGAVAALGPSLAWLGLPR